MTKINGMQQTVAVRRARLMSRMTPAMLDAVIALGAWLRHTQPIMTISYRTLTGPTTERLFKHIRRRHSAPLSVQVLDQKPSHRSR